MTPEQNAIILDAVAALRSLEWQTGHDSYGTFQFCPACRNINSGGHDEKCPTRKALEGLARL